MFSRTDSLRWRLGVSYAGLVLVVTALLTGLAVRTAAGVSLAAQREHALASVAGVAAAFTDALTSPLADPAQVARQQGLAADGRVLWLGGDGTVRVDGAGSDQLVGRPVTLPAELAGAGAGSGGVGGGTGSGASPAAGPAAGIYTTGTAWVAYASAPLTVAGRPAGQVLLVRDLSAVQRELSALQRQLWLLGAVLTLAGAGAGFLFANSLAQPLERLTVAVRRMATGDLRQSVAVAGTQETAALAEAFNVMAARVASLDEQRRAFVANAAHELRTPLAALHALAEGMNAGPEPGPEGLEGFIRQTDRLGRLVGSLLTLARLDNPELALHQLPIRVGNLLQEVRWVLRPLAGARDVALHMDGDAPEAWVNGDPDWLHQALVNVIDNAIRYTPEGGWVHTTIAADDDRVRITVTDSGPGVPPEALTRLGTRFYRVSAARERSSGAGGGGSGLGLAIVQEVVRLHGGTVAFAAPPAAGLTVTLSLPAAPAEAVVTTP